MLHLFFLESGQAPRTQPCCLIDIFDHCVCELSVTTVSMATLPSRVRMLERLSSAALHHFTVCVKYCRVSRRKAAVHHRPCVLLVLK